MNYKKRRAGYKWRNAKRWSATNFIYSLTSIAFMPIKAHGKASQTNLVCLVAFLLFYYRKKKKREWQSNNSTGIKWVQLGTFFLKDKSQRGKGATGLKYWNNTKFEKCRDKHKKLPFLLTMAKQSFLPSLMLQRLQTDTKTYWSMKLFYRIWYFPLSKYSKVIAARKNPQNICT